MDIGRSGNDTKADAPQRGFLEVSWTDGAGSFTKGARRDQRGRSSALRRTLWVAFRLIHSDPPR
jgi:hypothetical protein